MRRLLSYFAPLILLPLAQPMSAASATLAGVVVDQTNGAALAGARVKLTRFNDEEPLYAKTDWRGEFQFANLVPGAYSIRAEQLGYMMSGESPHNPGRSLWVDLTLPSPNDARSAPGRVKIAKKVDQAGVLHGEVTVELAPYGVVTGKLVDPNGTPLSLARIELLKVMPIPPGTTLQPGQQPLPDGQNMAGTYVVQPTDDRGEFRLARLEAGTYYLRCSGPPGGGQWGTGYRATYYSGALDIGSAKPVQLSVGQKVRADIQILRQAGVRVAGRLTSADGGSTANDARTYTRVILVAQNERRRDLNSGMAVVRDNEYEFNDVLPGTYFLVATTYEREAGVARLGGTQPLQGTSRLVDIGPADVAGLDLALRPLPDIQGVITFVGDCVRVPVQVQAHSSLGVTSRTPVRVDSPDGTFTIKRVGPGPVRLYANSFLPTSPFAWVVKMTLDGRDIQGQEFDTPLPNGAVVKITMGCPTMRTVRSMQ
jgi:hypothetical protein